MRIVAVVGGVTALIAAIIVVAWLSNIGFKMTGPSTGPKSRFHVPVSEKNAEGEYLTNPFSRPTKGPFPKVETTERVFDFGLMKFDPNPDSKGDSHVFVVRNVGEGTLWLARGPSTCQCTMNSLEDKVQVPPGGSTEITVTWKPTGPDDNFSKSASIWTNDPTLFETDTESEPGEGKLLFTVKGKVLHGVEVDPTTFSLGTLNETQPTIITAAIFSRVASDLGVSVKETSSRYVTAELAPMDKAQLQQRKALSGWILTGRIDPTIPVGRIRESITLTTTDNLHPEVSLSISAQRQGPLSLAGRFWNNADMLVDFRKFRAADGCETTLSLYAAKGAEPLQLTLLEQRPPELKLTIARDEEFPDPDRERLTIHLQVPPGLPPDRLIGKEAGYVRLATNRPDVPELKFYVIYESTE